VPQEYWSNAIFSIIPTLAVGLIFWFVMRAIMRSDRTERNSYAKIEAQERAKAAARIDAPPHS
jgi:flagellar biosynthesis/type III secretory pathway M-ring protein FliF/YscJ